MQSYMCSHSFIFGKRCCRQGRSLLRTRVVRVLCSGHKRADVTWCKRYNCLGCIGALVSLSACARARATYSFHQDTYLFALSFSVQALVFGITEGDDPFSIPSKQLLGQQCTFALVRISTSGPPWRAFEAILFETVSGIVLRHGPGSWRFTCSEQARVQSCHRSRRTVSPHKDFLARANSRGRFAP
jgi:hypothetical protein